MLNFSEIIKKYLEEEYRLNVEKLFDFELDSDGGSWGQFKYRDTEGGTYTQIISYKMLVLWLISGASSYTLKTIDDDNDKKIRMLKYLDKQTAYQIGVICKDCGYKVVYVF